MRIHDAYTKLDRATRTDGPGAAGKPGTGAGRTEDAGAQGATAPATSVSVSARAHELAKAATPSAGRVAELRDQIKRGDFKVDAQAIAKKLIGDDA